MPDGSNEETNKSPFDLWGRYFGPLMNGVGTEVSKVVTAFNAGQERDGAGGAAHDVTHQILGDVAGFWQTDAGKPVEIGAAVGIVSKLFGASPSDSLLMGILAGGLVKIAMYFAEKNGVPNKAGPRGLATSSTTSLPHADSHS